MALRPLINKLLKWNTSEAILLLAVVIELVTHLHGQILDYPPSDVKLIKNRVPLSISVTYDKRTCHTGWAGLDILANPYRGDIRLRNDSRRLINFYTDVVFNTRGDIYQQKFPTSANQRWCWIKFQQFDLKTLDFEILFFKPYFGLNKTQNWWPREWGNIHTGDKEDGGIVYSSERIWPMIENMTIISEWNGPLETLTAPFPVFKCAFTGWWRMSDGDRTTLNDDYYVYEVVMHEVVRTQSKEYNVIDGQELTLKIKPGFSEIINCEVASSASLRYEWVWQLKTRQDTSFRTINPRRFEIIPETTTDSYIKQERVWDDVDNKEMTSCKVRVITGRVGFVMDKESKVEGYQHYNGSQLRCLLVYEYDSATKHTVRNYTMNLEYDWTPIDAKHYEPLADCYHFKIAFGVVTLLTCLVYGVTCTYYYKKDAFWVEKWRHLRVPPVKPQHFRGIVNKYMKAMKKEKRFKTRFSKGTKKHSSNDKKQWSGNTGSPTLQLSKKNVKSNKNRSCYDPTEDPSGLWTPEQGAGDFAYKFSAQYYEDLRDCLEDTDQSYDDRNMISLRKRYREYFESLQKGTGDGGDGGDGPNAGVPLQKEPSSAYEEGVYNNGHSVSFDDVYGSSESEYSDQSGEDGVYANGEFEETSEYSRPTADGESEDDSDNSTDSDDVAIQSGEVSSDSNCEFETELSLNSDQKPCSIEDKKML